MKSAGIFIRHLLSITFFVLVFLSVGCTGGSGRQERQEQPKLQYLHNVNVVDTVTLRRGPFAIQVISNGRLSAKRKAVLSFSAAGNISSIKVSNGSFIKKGSVVAELDSRSQKLNLDAAKITLQKAELDMYDYLVGLGYKARDTVSVPSEVLESVKMQSGYFAAKSAYERCVYDLKSCCLYAPFSGKIADISKREFEQSSGVFCRIIDDSELFIEFPVMAEESSVCKVGSEVVIIPYSGEKHRFSGRITNINPTINESGQIVVTATLLNKGDLLDGQEVKVVVEKSVQDQLVVPKKAVVVRDNHDVLFTYSDSMAHWVYVEITASNEDHYSVVADKSRHAVLCEGDAVIVSGNLNLADKSKVEIRR